MKHAQLDFTSDFHVVAGNGRAQSAVMVLSPGDTTGGPDNRHRGADQWLFVVEGEGSAVVEGETHILRPRTLLLIEAGEAHEIRNEGDAPLKTLSFYTPPAYDEHGEELPAGRG